MSAKADLVIRNGLCPIQQTFDYVTLEIKGSTIVKIHSSTASPPATQTIDAMGCLILPQITDAHVHFREPGFPEKETISSGSSAALAGGVTTVLEMPNTKPRTTSINRIRDKIERGKQTSLVNIGFFAGLEDLSDLTQDYLDLACGLKIFTYELENPKSMLLRIYQKLTGVKNPPPLVFHAESPDIMKFERKQAEELLPYWNRTRPPHCEIQQIKEIVSIMESTPLATHICHVSTAEGQAILHDAKNRGLPISWEVTPHHLLLNIEEQRFLGVWGKVNPPIRPKSDQMALLNALKLKTIPMIASDHAPHSIEQKNDSDELRAPSGLIGVETTLPLLINLYNKGYIDLPYLYQLVCQEPARIYSLPDPTIHPGSTANLTIINLQTERKIKSTNLNGKYTKTPFEDWTVTGIIDMTIINGHLSYKDGEILVHDESKSSVVHESYSRSY